MIKTDNKGNIVACITTKEDFFKKLYKNMDKEEIIRVATEDKMRADRNARLLNKSIEKNRELIEEKDKEIERLNNIIHKAI